MKDKFVLCAGTSGSALPSFESYIQTLTLSGLSGRQNADVRQFSPNVWPPSSVSAPAPTSRRARIPYTTSMFVVQSFAHAVSAMWTADQSRPDEVLKMTSNSCAQAQPVTGLVHEDILSQQTMTFIILCNSSIYILNPINIHRPQSTHTPHIADDLCFQRKT